MSKIRWYAVVCTPRMEKVAAAGLKRQGFIFYYPFIRVRKSVKRAFSKAKRVHVEELPYYPGYLFVALRDSRPGESIYRVNKTNGVSTVVYAGGEPLEIPAYVMDEIMKKGDEAGLVGSVDLVSRKPFEKDDRVQFLNGPLSGLIATVSVDAGNKIKVWCESLKDVTEIIVAPEDVAEIA